MEIFIFTRFHAKSGKAAAFEEALREVVPASREEEGCLSIHAFRSIREPHVFYIHSRWRHEAAFEVHAKLPHTLRFIERSEPLLDHEIQAQRCEMII
jgi:quinol monooxygenase YgiN